MRLLETFQLSMKNIFANKVRTFLTMLGIIIGVTAVIIIVGLGDALKQYVTSNFAEMGTNTLNVSISGRGSTRSVSVDELYDFVHENPDYLDAVSPIVSLSNVKIERDSLDDTSASGVGEDYLNMKGYSLQMGRELQYSDITNRSKICVIGNYVSQTYYNGSALGQTIRINGTPLTIVGVLEQISDEMEEGGSDDAIFTPYSTAAQISGTNTFNSYLMTVVDENEATTSKNLVETYLYGNFEDEDAYRVNSMSELLDTLTGTINVMVNVLAIIAGISLLVGGIGIMNIMLISVTERTREIGIRKALGAKERFIMQQFVIEASTTSALGGILGILLGYLLSSVATIIITNMLGEPLAISPSASAILISFSISVGIGILFGYLPAKKASQLNPIDALRYD